MPNQTGDSHAIDAYIASFPESVQRQLQAMRAIIRGAAPEAGERISYQMPTFTFHGNLAHYAALKSHIGFYPRPSGIAAFADETARYGSTKGALRFPLDEPLPADLIARIVRFRVAENLARMSPKGSAKGSAKDSAKDSAKGSAKGSAKARLKTGAE